MHDHLRHVLDDYGDDDDHQDDRFHKRLKKRNEAWDLVAQMKYYCLLKMLTL